MIPKKKGRPPKSQIDPLRKAPSRVQVGAGWVGCTKAFQRSTLAQETGCNLINRLRLRQDSSSWRD